MNYKQDFLTALNAGMGYDALLDLVRRYQRQGLSAAEAYEVLQSIWLDLGFDGAEDGPLQDDLEAVMEKLWYERPA